MALWLFAVLVVLIMIAVIVAVGKKNKEIKWLKKYGKHVQATVSEIASQQRRIQVARQVPQPPQYDPVSKSMKTTYRTVYDSQPQDRYFIIARYEESPAKQAYVFKSKALAREPKHYMQGSKVLVHYDPANPSRYYMDLA